MSRCGIVVSGRSTNMVAGCNRGITGRSCGVPVSLLLWMVYFVTLVNPGVISVLGINLQDGGELCGWTKSQLR